MPKRKINVDEILEDGGRLNNAQKTLYNDISEYPRDGHDLPKFTSFLEYANLLIDLCKKYPDARMPRNESVDFMKIIVPRLPSETANVIVDYFRDKAKGIIDI